MLEHLLAAYPKLQEFDRAYLQATIARLAKQNNTLLIDDYIYMLQHNVSLVNALHEQLIVSYTDFFRDEFAFVYLQDVILPELLKSKQGLYAKDIRIWSLACSTGQEAYSIAMLLDHFEEHHHSDLKFQLFASDINDHSIAVAKQGMYVTELLNNLKIKQKKEFFVNVNSNNYKVTERLQQRVQFSVFNLLDLSHRSPGDSVFGGFDVIFCNNILYYYSDDEQSKILEKAQNNLNLGGYLFVSPTEKMSVLKHTNLSQVQCYSIFKKTTDI